MGITNGLRAAFEPLSLNRACSYPPILGGPHVRTKVTWKVRALLDKWTLLLATN